MSEPRPIPEGHGPLTPHLSVRDALQAIDFYRVAFQAREGLRLTGPGGKILHAELDIAGARIYLAEESPEWGNLSPAALDGTPVHLHLYVEDVDRVWQRAVESGAEILIPLADQFYGDRSGRLRDPFGHVWVLATRLEDVPPEEMQRRMDAMLAE